MSVDKILDTFVDRYDDEAVLLLLKTMAHPEQGGLGYSVELFNPAIDLDGFEVDHAGKRILLDRSGWLSDFSGQELAEALKKALETEIAKTRASLLARVGWGTGKVLLGVVEMGTGLVGILVPEPGTTVAGVIVFTLGTNTLVDGFSQLAGSNRGHGYNILSEGAGFAGAKLADIAKFDPELGRTVGEGVFLASSLVLGAWGSIRIIRIPHQTTLRLGVGGMPGGVQVGRIDLMYGSYRAMDGLTILSINNNMNKSILRFVMHDGRLVVNGRIFGVERVLQHESNPRAILKGLLKLLAHGAKQ